MSLKIEAGKFYRTRDGHKAFVAAVMLPCPFAERVHTQYPVRGFVDGSDAAQCWRADGAWHGSDKEYKYDLVAEWRKPLSIEEWQAVRRDSATYGVFFHTEEEARQWVREQKKPDEWAVIHTTGTEVW